MPTLEEIRALALPALGLAAVGYLLGSLPFGYWVAKAYGTDIFSAGSKSSGATNVGRVLGKPAGLTVFALDALKGVVAAGWPSLLLAPSHEVFNLAGLVGALVGHSFSCFTRFRGGKGVATGAGGFLVLMPLVTLIGAVVWILCLLVTRYVSLASLMAAFTLPVASVCFHRPLLLTVISALIAIFVGVRHRANIGRLLAGTENRWRSKPRGVA
jgi:glycerol-3-phosphate acyltransferase PlsY